MNIRHITWAEFDDAMAILPRPICDSFYPVPRGGLVLAVALSHRWNKPIVSRPTHMSIIVDDIVDSGQTLRKLRPQYPYPAYVLCKRSSCKEIAIHTGMIIENDDWIVFPWEDKTKAEEDYELYTTTHKRSI
jgi:hypoxanthine phosphoribosyltransferase